MFVRTLTLRKRHLRELFSFHLPNIYCGIIWCLTRLVTRMKINSIIRDPNCGGAYVKAVDDFLFGAISKCGRENPVLPIQPPTTLPVCV